MAGQRLLREFNLYQSPFLTGADRRTAQRHHQQIHPKQKETQKSTSRWSEIMVDATEKGVAPTEMERMLRRRFPFVTEDEMRAAFFEAVEQLQRDIDVLDREREELQRSATRFTPKQVRAVAVSSGARHYRKRCASPSQAVRVTTLR
jgi:hypothetical protein